MIVVENVLKVIDINYKSVDVKTIDFLKDYYTSYYDSMEDMAEDLLDIVTANESDALSRSKHRIVRKELKELAKLAEDNDAAYVRFTVI